jgi:hypothetical protein
MTSSTIDLRPTPPAPWGAAFDLSGCFRAYATRGPGADLPVVPGLPSVAPVFPVSGRRRRPVES